MFLCHTIPDRDYLDTLDLALLAADTWPPEAMKRGGTIYALTWGRNTEPETIDRFAAMVDADWFITGHQPCDDGFRQANHRQIIIDGTDPDPPTASSRHRSDDDRVAVEVRPHHRRHGPVGDSSRTAPWLPSSARQNWRSGGSTSAWKPCWP